MWLLLLGLAALGSCGSFCCCGGRRRRKAQQARLQGNNRQGVYTYGSAQGPQGEAAHSQQLPEYYQHVYPPDHPARAAAASSNSSARGDSWWRRATGGGDRPAEVYLATSEELADKQAYDAANASSNAAQTARRAFEVSASQVSSQGGTRANSRSGLIEHDGFGRGSSYGGEVSREASRGGEIELATRR